MSWKAFVLIFYFQTFWPITTMTYTIFIYRLTNVLLVFICFKLIMKLIKFCYFIIYFHFQKVFLVNLYKDFLSVTRLLIFCTTLFTNNNIKVVIQMHAFQFDHLRVNQNFHNWLTTIVLSFLFFLTPSNKKGADNKVKNTFTFWESLWFIICYFDFNLDFWSLWLDKPSY